MSFFKYIKKFFQKNNQVARKASEFSEDINLSMQIYNYKFLLKMVRKQRKNRQKAPLGIGHPFHYVLNTLSNFLVIGNYIQSNLLAQVESAEDFKTLMRDIKVSISSFDRSLADKISKSIKDGSLLATDEYLFNNYINYIFGSPWSYETGTWLTSVRKLMERMKGELKYCMEHGSPDQAKKYMFLQELMAISIDGFLIPDELIKDIKNKL